MGCSFSLRSLALSLSRRCCCRESFLNIPLHHSLPEDPTPTPTSSLPPFLCPSLAPSLPSLFSLSRSLTCFSGVLLTSLALRQLLLTLPSIELHCTIRVCVWCVRVCVKSLHSFQCVLASAQSLKANEGKIRPPLSLSLSVL